MHEELIKETDKKFVERVLAMVFQTCGCDKERGIKILKKALKEAEKNGK